MNFTTYYKVAEALIAAWVGRDDTLPEETETYVYRDSFDRDEFTEVHNAIAKDKCYRIRIDVIDIPRE